MALRRCVLLGGFDYASLPGAVSRLCPYNLANDRKFWLSYFLSF